MGFWKHTRTAALAREVRRRLAEHVSDGSRNEIAASGHSPGPLGKEILRLFGEPGRLGILQKVSRATRLLSSEQ